MKTFLLSIVMTLVQFVFLQAQATILPLEFILKKHAQVSGSGILSVEQDVQFTDGIKTYTVRETWLIEGDRNLKLSVRGLGELRDAINLNYLYNNKTRTSLVPPSKARVTKTVGPDFFERWLAIKSKDSTMAYLKELNIKPQVQLGRAAGRICFLIGETTNPDVQLKTPHVWIDQDQFYLVKLLLPSQAQVEFKNYSTSGNINYPREKQVQFDDQIIKITVNKFSANKNATIQEFYPETLEMVSTMKLEAFGSVGESITQFYSRFR